MVYEIVVEASIATLAVLIAIFVFLALLVEAIRGLVGKS